MKKRTVVLLIGVIFAGVLSYLGGYYYMHEKPQIQLIEPVSLQRNMLLSDDSSVEQLDYFVAKIEKRMLYIYRMPENVIYDSVKLESLQLSEEDYSKLLEGIHFENLTEVFEFLENSMS